MGRRDYQHYRTTCSKGINQQAELVGPGEVIDAQNVWAPNGKLQSRPGFRNEGTVGRGTLGVVEPFEYAILYNVSGDAYSTIAYNAAISSTYLSSGDIIHLSIDSTYDSSVPTYSGFRFEMTTSLTAAGAQMPFGVWEYYNGSGWVPLNNVTEHTGEELDASSAYYHLFYPEATADTPYFLLLFKSPSDWSTTTVDSATDKYMIRVRLDVGTVSGAGLQFASAYAYSEERAITEVLSSVRFSNKSRMISIARAESASSNTINVSSDVRKNWQRTLSIGSSSERGHSSVAVVPQFDEAFFCFGGITARMTPTPLTTDDPYARVETDQSIIGDKAPYDPDYISQETSWPESDFILFFKGRLWSARGSVVRWSAPQPYHKVWPKLSQEPIMEDDNSDITGLVGFGEHVVVFKRESIYIMPSVGENEFSLEQYTPVRVVSGVGCIAPQSIQKIRGRLVFLAEDGLYAFDGTPNIKKVTEKAYQNTDGSAEIADRMSEFFSSLNPGHRRFSASANWASKRCYLLSLSTEADTENSKTFVWDYANDAMWIWSGFSAKKWMIVSEGADDSLFFVDNLGFIFRLGVGNDDNYAAITSSITTHRIGYREGDKKRFRQVDVTSTNESGPLTIDVIPQDNDRNKSTATMSKLDAIDTVWSDTITDTVTEWSQIQKKSTRVGFRADADFAQVKVTHSDVHQPFMVTLLDVGWIPLGER